MEVDVLILRGLPNREARREYQKILKAQSSSTVNSNHHEDKSGKRGDGGKHIWRSYQQRSILKDNVNRFKRLHGLSDYDFKSYGGEMISKSTLELFIGKPAKDEVPTTATQEWKIMRKLGVKDRMDIYKPIDFNNILAEMESTQSEDDNNNELGNKFGKSSMNLTKEQRENLLNRVTDFMSIHGLTQQEFMTFSSGVAVLETELDNIVFGNEEVSESLLRNIALRMGLSIKEALEPMTTTTVEAKQNVFNPLQGEQAEQARKEVEQEKEEPAFMKARRKSFVELTKAQRSAIKTNTHAFMQAQGLHTPSALGKVLRVSHPVYKAMMNTDIAWHASKVTLKKIADNMGIAYNQLLKPSVPVIAKAAKVEARTEAPVPVEVETETEPVLETPIVKPEVTEETPHRKAKAKTVTSHVPARERLNEIAEEVKQEQQEKKEAHPDKTGMLQNLRENSHKAVPVEAPVQELVPADKRRLNLKAGKVSISIPVGALKGLSVDDDGNINLEL